MTTILAFHGPPKPDAFTPLEAFLKAEAARIMAELKPEMERRISYGENPALVIREGRDALQPITAQLVRIHEQRPLPPVLIKTEE